MEQVRRLAATDQDVFVRFVSCKLRTTPSVPGCGSA